MQVSNISELKEAIKSNAESIEIIDASLANKIKIFKASSRGVIVALVVAGGIAATNWWNPVGATTGFAALTANGTLAVSVAFLVTSLGVSLLWALFNDWEIDAVVEGDISKAKGRVHLKLKPKKSCP